MAVSPKVDVETGGYGSYISYEKRLHAPHNGKFPLATLTKRREQSFSRYIVSHDDGADFSATPHPNAFMILAAAMTGERSFATFIYLGNRLSVDETQGWLVAY